MIAAVIEGIRPITANEKHRGDARARRGRKARVQGPVVVTLVVTPPDRRRRDLDGLAPTLKRMLDGIVRAGVIRDDSDDVVTEVRIRRTVKGTDWRLELHVTPDLWEALT